MTAPRLLPLALLVAAAWAQAQNIRVDGSTGVAAQTLKGPNYQIDQQLGRLAGTNLFHSFQFFNLNPQESASFLLQSPEVAQVIARVTGGSPSLLQGALQLLPAPGGTPTPSLFFINPAGVVFGAGFSLEVPGGFHASTAPQLLMADGSRWESSGGNSFSTAPPQAFGFLGPAAAVLTQDATLQGAAGQALHLLGGDISISGGLVDASGGLRLVASGTQALDVPLDGAPSAAAGGVVLIDNAALVRVSTSGALDAGALRVDAGSLMLIGGAGLRSRTRIETTGDGGAIDLRLGQQLSMSGGSFIESLTGTAAPGGRISLQAGSALLDGDAYVWSYSLAGGHAGGIDLLLGQSLLMSGAANLYSSSYGAGNGADLRVRAPLISLSDGAFITSDGLSSGRSGAVDVEASQGLLMQGAELIGLSTGSGGGGDIRLASQGLLLLDDVSRISVAATGSGPSGLLSLTAAQLWLTGASRISHSAQGLGSTGETRLHGASSLMIDSQAEVRATSEGQSTGAIRLSGGDILLGPDAYLFNSAQQPGAVAGDLTLSASGLLAIDGATLVNRGIAGGRAGKLLLQGRDVLIGGASALVSSSSDAGSGAGNLDIGAGRSIWVGEGASLISTTSSELAAGRIRLAAPAITLDGAALATSAFDGGGNAGRLELLAGGALTVSDSIIQSATFGAGNAGSLLFSGQDIRVDGRSLIFASVGDASSGSGGDIRLQATRNLALLAGSAIDTSTLSGNGNAGQLLLSAGSALRVDGAKLSSVAGEFATGNAGAITLQSGGTLAIGPQSLVTTATLGAGDAGRLRFEAASITLSGADISSDAIAGTSGDAGRIELVAQSLLDIGGGSRLSSGTAGSGSAGSLLLQAGDQLLLRGGAQLGAIAYAGSGGQTGSIELQAGSLIRVSELASVQISNLATVANPQALRPTLLRLQAPRIELSQALLTASATGNADASRIELLAGDDLLMTESAATTTAQDGNGGALTARAGGLMKLKNAGLITSVLGNRGNGGDIDIEAGVLLLDGGFIQANTAAPDASGGDVRIRVGALLARGNRVVIGGDAPLLFNPLNPLNVIQAAAPDGVSGVVAVSSTIDLTGSLVLLDRSLLDPGGLGRSPCDRPGGSALAQTGRGAIPAATGGPLGAPPSPRPPPLRAGAQAPGMQWGDCR